jgi:hypothetical protein
LSGFRWRAFTDVLHTHPAALPVMDREQKFAVVAGGIGGGLDDEEAIHS